MHFVICWIGIEPLSVRIECAHYSVNYFVRMNVANAIICYFYSTMALVSHLKAIL